MRPAKRNALIKSTVVAAISAAASLSIACASATPGAQPRDMSVAQHEAMAANEDETAQRQAALFRSDASVETKRCNRGASPDNPDGAGCWTSISNPTAEHLDEAKKHRQMASDHRAASQALRDAEATACVGLPEEDRDMSPFEHREDIASVEPLTVKVSSSKGDYAKTEGAVITFRAVPGMTTPWLQRVVDCHLARNAALGHVVPEMPDCPLVPKNVTARVTATNVGFAVAVSSDDSNIANEILRRSRRLIER
jgi:hypothetical protein